MSKKASLVAALAGALLSGCVSVLPKASPAAPRYLIAPASFSSQTGAPVPWSLAIEDPIATRVYDNTKIALVREEGRIEFYANGEWADRAPRLVQTALIRSFENSGRILGVGDRSSLSASDFVLQTDIRNMHADYTNGRAPATVITVFARLTNRRGQVIAAHLFERRVVAAVDTVPSVTAAFGEAITAVLGEMAAWSLEEANAAYAK